MYEKIAEFIKSLEDAGFTIALSGDKQRIECTVSDRELTTLERETITQNREAILEYLRFRMFWSPKEEKAKVMALFSALQERHDTRVASLLLPIMGATVKVPRGCGKSPEHARTAEQISREEIAKLAPFLSSVWSAYERHDSLTLEKHILAVNAVSAETLHTLASL